MPTANVKIHPARADDTKTTSGRLTSADQRNMDPEEDWKILHARFPWKRYQSESIEQKYNVFRKEKMLSISKHLPLSSAVFGGIFFALSIFYFNEEKVPAILTTCIFLLVNIAVLSLYCAKEIQTNTSHIVSLFVFVLPFFLLVCVQLLDFRDISASGTRLEWVAFFVFLAFVTLPVRYWVCCAMILILFLGQLSAVVYKFFKNRSSPMDILYQVSHVATEYLCETEIEGFVHSNLMSLVWFLHKEKNNTCTKILPVSNVALTHTLSGIGTYSQGSSQKKFKNCFLKEFDHQTSRNRIWRILAIKSIMLIVDLSSYAS